MAQVVPALEGPTPTCVDLNSVEDHVKKRMGGSLVLGAAIDGSNMSDRAMQVALSFHNQKRGDKLKIIHVSDRTKNYLQRHLQPTHLRHYYEDLAGASRVQADWICREKEEGKTTCETLTGLADKNGIDILVVGSFGRKGEKLDLLGTVSDFSLRQAHSSICIVRSTSSKWDRQCKFLFSTDGSQAAALAFSILVTHLRKPQDRVDVVFVTTKDEVDEAANVKHYQEYMAKHKVIGDCAVKCIDRLTQRVPDGILEASLERDCDVLVLGISGYGKKKLGSVSETISMRATCTTLIIKDSRELFGNHYLGAASIMADITPNGSAGSSSRKTLAA